MNLNEIRDGIASGDVRSLAKGITLIESQRLDHRTEAMALLDQLYSKRKPSMRIGITGIPGVGKSTFIEALGRQVLSDGRRLAVLAIDPSSSRSDGSILGDKTRMEWLSKQPNVFIRPSPAGRTLGGVAQRTRETMLLCEAAGFDTVFIESVGVGQSETELTHITDAFLMLAMPGTGDELQGIKRGIMEAADLVFVNKRDQDPTAADRTKRQLQMALHLMPAPASGIPAKVLSGSALQDEGVASVWDALCDRHAQMLDSGWMDQCRSDQQRRAFEKMAELFIYEYVLQQFGSGKKLEELRANLGESINEFRAILSLNDHLRAQ